MSLNVKQRTYFLNSQYCLKFYRFNHNNLVMEEMQAKLKPIMAQRSIAVIEDCLEKLAFLGSITPDVLAHRDELSRK